MKIKFSKEVRAALKKMSSRCDRREYIERAVAKQLAQDAGAISGGIVQVCSGGGGWIAPGSSGSAGYVNGGGVGLRFKVID